MASRLSTLATIGLVLAAMLLRLGLVIQAGGCREDPDNYLPLARSLVAGEGYQIKKKPTAYRPPLYPILLAPLVSMSGDAVPWAIGGLHVLLGGATVALTGAFVRRASGKAYAPWLAMTIVAFDPVLAVQARGVMTETLAAALTAVSLWGASREGTRGALLGGLGFGFSTLCRPSLLPGAVLVSLARVGKNESHPFRSILEFLLFWLVLASVMAPWTIRNWLVLGAPIWSTTHGGYTLALANNPFYYADVLDGPSGAVWSGENQKYWARQIYRATLTMEEPEADRAIQEGTIAFMWDHPDQVMRASLARLGRFWGVAPAGAVYPWALRMATLAWTIPFWILVALGLCGGGVRGWPLVSALLVVVGLTAVHCFYWTDLRMRAPIVPALAAIAADASIPGVLKLARRRVQIGLNR